MRRAVAASSLVCLTFAACGSNGGSATSSGSPVATSPSAGSPSPTSTSSAAPSAPPAVSGPCANDYFPVVAGATWTYRRTVAGSTVTGRQTLRAIGDTGFTVIVSSPQGGERDVWTCSHAGLADTQQYVTGVGGGPPPPGTVVFHGFTSRGVTIPAGLHVGQTWTQVVTSHGKVPLAGATYPETQAVTTTSRVLGQASVTTPAGTFQALKVQVTTSTHKTAPSLGMDTTDVSHGTEWVARGVGMVQSLSTNASGFHFTVLLLTYHIP